MTLPIAPTLFSRWQCVVGDRLKGTCVFENDEKSSRKFEIALRYVRNLLFVPQIKFFD